MGPKVSCKGNGRVTARVKMLAAVVNGHMSLNRDRMGDSSRNKYVDSYGYTMFAASRMRDPGTSLMI